MSLYFESILIPGSTQARAYPTQTWGSHLCKIVRGVVLPHCPPGVARPVELAHIVFPMDIELLKTVGQIAGIGGLALGVFLFLFRDLIRKAIFPTLKKEDAYKLLRLVAVLVWSATLTGIGAWVWIEMRTEETPPQGIRPLSVWRNLINGQKLLLKNQLTTDEIEKTRKLWLEEGRSSIKGFSDLAEKLKVTDSALDAFFRILNERLVPAEKLLEVFAQIVVAHLQLVGRMEDLRDEVPEFEARYNEAAAEIENGNYGRADALLAQLGEAQLIAAQKAGEAREKHLHNVASTSAERGELRLVQLDYRVAAEHFHTAANQIPASEPHLQAHYLERQGEALQRLGEERGDLRALRHAVAVLKEALRFRKRAYDHQKWAFTSNNTGNTLLALGEATRQPSLVNQAITYYREALKNIPSTEAPLEWATVQSNMGYALQILGHMTQNSVLLDEAVNDSDKALTVFTPKLRPLQWAHTMNYRASAFALLGEMKADPLLIRQAIQIVRETAEIYTRDSLSFEWAKTQNAIGYMLAKLGELEGDTSLLKEAVPNIHRALEEFTPERYGNYRAHTLHSLGFALSALGQLSEDDTCLENAVITLRAASSYFEAAGIRPFEELADDLNNAEAALEGMEPRESPGTVDTFPECSLRAGPNFRL